LEKPLQTKVSDVVILQHRYSFDKELLLWYHIPRTHIITFPEHTKTTG